MHDWSRYKISSASSGGSHLNFCCTAYLPLNEDRIHLDLKQLTKNNIEPHGYSIRKIFVFKQRFLTSIHMRSIFWTRAKLMTMLSAWRFVVKSVFCTSVMHINLRKGLLSSIKLRAKNMRLGKHLPCFWCVPTWLVYILWSYVICIYGCNSRWLGVRFMDVVPGLDILNMTSAGPSQWLSWYFLEQCSHCDSKETSFVWHSLPQKAAALLWT